MTQKIKMTVAGADYPGLKVAIGVKTGDETRESLSEMALTFYRILTKRFENYFAPAPGNSGEPDEVKVLFEDDVEEDEEEEAWFEEEEEDDDDEDEAAEPEQELKYK